MPRTLIRLVALVALLIVLAIMWRYLASTGVLTAEQLEHWIGRLETVRSSPWGLPAAMVVYVVALLLAFPLTLLVVLTGLLFGPWWGLLYASLGTLSSSGVTFWLGHLLGQAPLERHSGKHLKALSGYMSERGVRAMILINLLPLAPFTFTNLMAGAFNMPFGRYMVGSAIGIIPGLAFVTVLGGQASRMLQAENNQDLFFAIAVLVIVALLFATVIVLARRYRNRSA
ncbi:TVP38/TMEM64 family protein [Saccharospirillum impatiens]|uniref:TVP38/TMEM64 family protein n=1 Tax=Saccharospirillum impatiens TaxID=169438 RepID=UPI000402CE90|nr:VTT domain-containing protein [Saccharospirillum impatiens]